MKVTIAEIPDVLILSRLSMKTSAGSSLESFNQKNFEDATGQTDPFVQDNLSRSVKNVLRGLHYQIKHAAGKAGERRSR